MFFAHPVLRVDSMRSIASGLGFAILLACVWSDLTLTLTLTLTGGRLEWPSGPVEK